MKGNFAGPGIGTHQRRAWASGPRPVAVELLGTVCRGSRQRIASSTGGGSRLSVSPTHRSPAPGWRGELCLATRQRGGCLANGRRLNLATVALGRLGAHKGWESGAESLSAKKHSQTAKKISNSAMVQ